MNEGIANDIQRGMEVEKFLESPVGRELWLRADDEIREAMDEFLKLDPTDTSAIIKVQIKATAAYDFKKFVSEFISSAEAARSMIANADVSEPDY